jgi:protein-disulfide isomerase
MTNRRAILAGGAGLGILAFGGIGLARFATGPRPAGAEGGPDPAAVLFDPDQPVLGNPDGDVTVAEFFDYQCPFCKRGHDALMEEVAADGGVRLIMKDWPIFGGASVAAAQMALGGVARGEYAAAQAALMATPARLTEDQVRAALTGAGLDTDALMASYREAPGRWDGLMTRNGAQAAALGLQGTPAFIVGYSIHAGALDSAGLRAAIADARAGS